MALTHEESVDLEQLKHKNKLDFLASQEVYAEKEHKRKVERLNLLLEIAKAGGVEPIAN